MYTDFSDPPLIAKCQKCHTQNTKSLHSKLFHGLDQIMVLACVTSLDHNFSSEEGVLLWTLTVDSSVEKENWQIQKRQTRQSGRKNPSTQP